MLQTVRVDPPWDQRLANLLIRPLLTTSVTPNMITTVGLLIGVGALVCYGLGGALAHLGAALFMACYVIDHADGELARLTGKTSAVGHYYDLAVDGLVVGGVFVAMGIGLDNAMGPGGQAGSLSMTSLGLIAGVSIALIFVLRLELERRFSKAATRQPNLMGFEAQDVLYLIGPITWFGWLEAFLTLAAIGAPIYALWVCWECWSWFRDASAGE
jgi:phosphatidylglycerophosphate synthase